MDEIRRFRFQVAPLLFLISLGWGTWFDPSTWNRIAESALTNYLKQNGIGASITVIASGSIVVFAMGLVIGTFSYVGLRCVFLLDGCCRRLEGVNTHEVYLADHTLSQIWSHLNPAIRLARSMDFYAAVAFDHGILQTKNEGVYHWMVRRWNAFSLSVTSISGLMLSLIVGWIFHIAISWQWLSTVAVLLTLFAINAFFAWNDTMRMLAFQATLPLPDPKSGSQIRDTPPRERGWRCRAARASLAAARRDREVRCDAGAAPATVSGEIAARSTGGTARWEGAATDDPEPGDLLAVP